MNIRIRCSREKVKELMSALQRAYERGDVRGVKQISAILRIHEGQKVKAVAELFDVTVQTVYNWLKPFLLEGCNGFQLKRSPGRKPRLSKSQKQELKQCLLSSPTEHGYDCGCWISLLVQYLIYSKWGGLYHRGYICNLLHGRVQVP